MSDCPHNAPDHGPNEGDVQTQWQQLDQPNNEELLDRLADCLYSLEGEADIASIDRCLEELEQAGESGGDFDVEQSLQEFHERYAPAFESSPGVNKKNGPRVRRPLARIAIIAAVLCAFLVTAQASGFDILGAIARWTSQQFAFVRPDDKHDPSPGFQSDSLEGALEKYHVEENLAPTRFPEETVLSDLTVRQEKENLAFLAEYLLREREFYISIRKVADVPYGDIEINDPDVEIYSAGGVEHYLMADVKQRKVMWRNGAWECYIAGDLTREELRLMIDSIYK